MKEAKSQQPGNVPITALLMRLRRDIEQAMGALEERNTIDAMSYLEQARDILLGKGIF